MRQEFAVSFGTSARPLLSMCDRLQPCAPERREVPELRLPVPRAGNTRAVEGDDVGQGEGHCTVRLVYRVLHGLALPVWRGMRSRPRRVHSRLGGAAVISLLARELGISSASIVEACWKWLLCPSRVGNKAIFSRP